jgi:hypothetical protein
VCPIESHNSGARGWNNFRFGEHAHKDWMEHLRGRLLVFQVWVELNIRWKNRCWILYKQDDHELNVLRFWIKIWCPTHLYNCSRFDVIIPKPSHDPTNILSIFFCLAILFLLYVTCMKWNIFSINFSYI